MVAADPARWFRQPRKKVLAPELSYPRGVAEYRFTEYFEKEVLRKRPYLRKEWCIRAVEQPLRFERQEHNRYRFWAELPELEGK